MHIARMKIHFLLSLLLCGFLAVFTGCVETADGHHQAGFPAKDTLVKKFPRPLAQVQKASRAVIARNGNLEVDNIVAKTLQARIQERVVFIRLSQVDTNMTEVTIQVRTKMGGDIDLASELSTQIALELQSM
jgi:hypothetical protein